MHASTDRVRLSDLGRYGVARAPVAGDEIDGVLPAAVVEPESAEQAAAALAYASAERLTTVIRGGGTKLGWGRPPQPIDLVLATSRLTGSLVHRHGDLTATVRAGETLRDVNAQLFRQGQWLPVDSAFDAATIGGIVATNDAGPLRTRYGTPRDLVIGVTLAMTDGRVVKSGGHVVKNVAGYDLGRLMSGSFGTLALIADVTLKLLPLPAASRTLVAAYGDDARLCEDAARVAASQLEPTAFDVRMHWAPGRDRERRLLVRFATSPEAVDAQIEGARAAMSGSGAVESLADSVEHDLWTGQVRQLWSAPGVVVRLGWLPAALPQVLALAGELQQVTGGAVDLCGRVITGAGVLRLEADEAKAQRAVALLRSREGVVSNVVVLRQSASLEGRVDAWGPSGRAASALASLKRTFDPAGILNAGRGPI